MALWEEYNDVTLKDNVGSLMIYQLEMFDIKMKLVSQFGHFWASYTVKSWHWLMIVLWRSSRSIDFTMQLLRLRGWHNVGLSPGQLEIKVWRSNIYFSNSLNQLNFVTLVTTGHWPAAGRRTIFYRLVEFVHVLLMIQ